MTRPWAPQLKTLFGLDSLRPHQEPIMDHVMAGDSALIVMATGGGKSLCFQFPASQLEGVTIVFSPLISLMTDQERALGKTGVTALAINSFLSYQETSRRIKDAIAGKAKLLYIAPERLQSPTFMQSIQQVRVAMIAVDEAHCVTEWGHDFRPDYRRIAMFRELVGNPPVVALTATATPAVRKDILRQLRLEDAKTFHSTCNRPEIFIEVRAARSAAQRAMEIAKAVGDETTGSIIVYVSSREDTGEIASAIEQQTGLKALPYHAKMPAEERRKVHAAFMADDVRVVVATNAFGMGIDKPNIRLVAHAGLPGSLEAYYQEIGRAGRDVKPAKSLLIYTDNDFKVRRFLIDKSHITKDGVERTWRLLQAAQPGTTVDIYTKANDHRKSILVELEWKGAIQRPSGQALTSVTRLAVADEQRLIQDVADHFARQYRHNLKRFAVLQKFLTSSACRRDTILKYFGEQPLKQTRCCDFCARAVRATVNRVASPQPPPPRIPRSQPSPQPARPAAPYVQPVSLLPESRDLAESHHIVKTGERTWFVPLYGGPRTIYLHNPANPGSLTFRFGDVEYKDLWSSNAHALRTATGIDLTGEPST